MCQFVVVNEVQFAYNDFGQITNDYRAHAGAVSTSTTPQLQYGYASGSANTIRPTSITYPDGRVITYGYGSSDSMADVLSRMAANGDGTWDLNQFRSANRVNEITDITESAGPSWATPVYNRAGNMTTIPKLVDPTESFTGTYDAWNRLVKLEDGSGIVAQYEYDGAKRRTVKKTYTSGTLSETRHFYYTEPSRWLGRFHSDSRFQSVR